MSTNRTLVSRIQLNRGTYAQWQTNPTVLYVGELAVETDTNKFKFGNGVDIYRDLPYASTEDNTVIESRDPTTADIEPAGLFWLNVMSGKLWQTLTPGVWRQLAYTDTVVDHSITTDRLVTPRTITISGDTVGNASFDGSTNINIGVALTETGIIPGTYTKLTVGADGRVYGSSNIDATDLPLVGIPGTYTKVTTDQWGRVTVGTTLLNTDIPDIGQNQVTGLVGRLDGVDSTLASHATNLGTINTTLTNKADKLNGATYGNITTVAADGRNFADSGKSFVSTVGTLTDNQVLTALATKNYIDQKVATAREEGVIFRGILANQTLLPTTGNQNGDLFWITTFIAPAPPGITEGLSGAAIFHDVAHGGSDTFEFTQDTIYEPDNQTIILNLNGQLAVQVSTAPGNALSATPQGMFVDLSSRQTLLGGGTSGTVLTNTGTPGTVGSLAVDTAPTSGSSNLVTAGGVWTANQAFALRTTTINGFQLTNNITLTTTNIAEGTNLYYTEARVTANFNTNFSAVRGLSENDFFIIDGRGQQ